MRDLSYIYKDLFPFGMYYDLISRVASLYPGPGHPQREGIIQRVDTWGRNLGRHLESCLPRDLSQSTQREGTPPPTR